MIKDVIAEDFQLSVEAHIKRNKNLLDALTKFEAASARLSRAAVKAGTQCGCIEISGRKNAGSGVEGELCGACREVIEKELGDTLFYAAAIAGTLGISLYDVMLKEKKQLDMLGDFSLK